MSRIYTSADAGSVPIEQELGRVVGMLHAENAALRAELAARWGDDIGPWRRSGECYVLDVEDGPYPAVKLHVDGVRWIPHVNDDVKGRQCSGEPAGLLTAMRAAAEDARAFGWSGDAAIPDTRASEIEALRRQVAELRENGVSLHKATAAGHDAGVAAERAAAMSWLRSQADTRFTGTWAAAQIEAGEHVRYYDAEGSDFANYDDAIERGEHVAKRGGE